MNGQNIFNRKFAAVLLVILGGLLAISPAGLKKAQSFSPREIAAAITSKSDHVTAEELAAWLVDKRPDILIVDIRPSEEYQQYHIPGAINIPLAKLFDPESLELLDQDRIVILYSNGGTHAAQAWVMLKQLGIESYVLLGGLNYWVEAILNPNPPGDLVADSEILKYQFRKSVSGYFGGSGVKIEEQKKHTVKPKIKPKFKLHRKKEADEGC